MLYLPLLLQKAADDAIALFGDKNASGHKVQDVEISYNYIGILPANLLYDIQKGKTA